MTSAGVRLKAGRQERLIGGHLWVYANEIAAVSGDAAPGSVVDVSDGSGRFLGRGHYSPCSQIAVRLLTRQQESVDRDFLGDRIASALRYRDRVLADPSVCRLVFSESDLLPGLIADRYGPVVVMSVLTAGMDRARGDLAELLGSVPGVETVVERSDSRVRGLEGLPRRVEVVKGSLPGAAEVGWGGLTFGVDVMGGQKTGLFLDQRFNHAAVARRCAGKRVLDLFCHAGGFGLHAAAAGAVEVLGIDSSHAALEAARGCASLHALQDRTEWQQADAFDALRDLGRSTGGRGGRAAGGDGKGGEGGRFDVVICDPPAFAREKSSVEGALRGYRDLALHGMKLLPRSGGLLAMFTCSHGVGRDALLGAVLGAAREGGRFVRVVEEYGQPPDHPVLAGHAETEYLRGLMLWCEQ
jgi:23S rRNA (cytosine1962-C5)-methyltransferase